MDRFSTAEDVGNNVGAVQTRQHVIAVANTTMDKSHVMNRVKWRKKGIAGENTNLRLDRKFPYPLDQFIAGLAVGDQFGDADAQELVALGKGGELGSVHHGAVVVHEFGEHSDGRQAGKLA